MGGRQASSCSADLYGAVDSRVDSDPARHEPTVVQRALTDSCAHSVCRGGTLNRAPIENYRDAVEFHVLGCSTREDRRTRVAI